jgi:hypothetical protein
LSVFYGCGFDITYPALGNARVQKGESMKPSIDFLNGDRRFRWTLIGEAMLGFWREENELAYSMSRSNVRKIFESLQPIFWRVPYAMFHFGAVASVRTHMTCGHYDRNTETLSIGCQLFSGQELDAIKKWATDRVTVWDHVRFAWRSLMHAMAGGFAGDIS